MVRKIIGNTLSSFVKRFRYLLFNQKSFGILLGGASLLVVLVDHRLHELLRGIDVFLCPYSDFLVRDSVQNRAEIHVFGSISQQGAEIEEFLAVGEDLRDDAAHREDIRAPATGSFSPNFLLDIAGLVRRQRSVGVAGRIRVGDLAARHDRNEEKRHGILDDSLGCQITGVALLRGEEVGEIG